MTTGHSRSLITSLVPGSRLDVQHSAVASWFQSGFEVATFNAPSELEDVSKDFPGVTCATALRDGRLATGRPVVFINDLLQKLRDTGFSVGGIINSDILIAPKSNIRAFLEDMPNDCLLACPRTEVHDFSEDQGTLDLLGYDAFLFHRTLLPDWNETRFCLGMPFWDHWFPMMALLAGRRLLKPVSADFRHIPHPVSRDDSFFMFNDHFAEIMISKMRDNQIGFGEGFEVTAYGGLREAAVRESEASAPDDHHSQAFAELAQYFDGLTKYVIKFIDEQAEKIVL